MRILIISNSALSVDKKGVYTDIFNGKFVEELIEQGNEVSFLHFKSDIRQEFASCNLLEIGCNVILMRTYRNKIVKYLTSYLRLLFVIPKYDFVYLYYPTSFKYVAFLCKLFRVEYGLYIRGMYGIAHDKLSKLIYKNAKIILTVSDAFSKTVNEILKEKKAKSIRPMIPYSSDDIVLDRSYSDEKKEIRLLYFARVAKEKGVEELLRAFKIVSELYAIHLVLVGDGEYFEQTKGLVKELSLEEKVSLEGICNDEAKKRKYFLDADIYILPTYHEGFPRTLYEAMIFGTPIITTFVGGISALMKDQYNCMEIKPRSVESIVEVLEYAINNYREMIRLTKNGFNTVSEIVAVNRPSHARMLNDELKYCK
ncbi:MAG: glycosyltransferase family 4 protein [Candidatus Onthomorpha sp.]|nr:glycosyltransferase family 4 protein [Candidatus Onthomorpha sp.]